jgi:hypothetical protein
MLEAVQEELVVELITGVVGIPNFVPVSRKNVPVHSYEEEVVRSKSVCPELEMGQRLRPGIIAEYGAERKEETRCLDFSSIVHAIAKGSPDACASHRGLMDWVLVLKIFDVVVQRRSRDIQGEVLGGEFGFIKGSEEVVDLACVATEGSC